MSDQCFCLRWNNYQSSVVGVLRALLEEGQFVDVTLACDGRRLKAHKLMLSACSNFFRDLLKENPSEHPIIFLRDVRFWELESIMDFIYNGQVNVMQQQLPGFIRTAEALQIKGLAAVNNNNNNIHTKMPDPRLFVGDLGGRIPEPYLVGGGDTGGEPHQPPPLKRPRRPPPATHNLLPPSPSFRPEVQPLVGKVPQEEVIAKVSATMPSQAAAKPLPPSTEGGRTDPAAGTTAPPNALIAAPRSSSPPPGPEKNGLKMETEQTSPDAESDVDIGSNDSLPQTDTPKDGEWSPGDSQANLGLNFNEGGYPLCKVCGKVFKHQGSLVAHYQVHQLRTKCPVCKKVLSRHYHMKVHLLTVHKVPDAEIEGLLRSQNIV